MRATPQNSETQRIQEWVKQQFSAPQPSPLSVALEYLATKAPQRVGTVLRLVSRLFEASPQDTLLAGPVPAGAILTKKEMQGLLKALDVVTRPRVKPAHEEKALEEITKTLTSAFRPQVVLPMPEILTERALHGKTTALEQAKSFLQAVNEMPKAVLDKLRSVMLGPRISSGGYGGSGQIAGFFDPEGRRVIVTTATRPEYIPQIMGHEMTHAGVYLQPQSWDEAMQYLDTAGWPLSRKELRQPGFEEVAHLGNAMALPLKRLRYPVLTRYSYVQGWPYPPLETPPFSWGPRATYHPVEDIAEAGSYAILGETPYREFYGRQIQDLDASKRRVIRNLIEKIVQ